MTIHLLYFFMGYFKLLSNVEIIRNPVFSMRM